LGFHEVNKLQSVELQPPVEKHTSQFNLDLYDVYVYAGKVFERRKTEV